jgi:hypothetical protein
MTAAGAAHLPFKRRFKLVSPRRADVTLLSQFLVSRSRGSQSRSRTRNILKFTKMSMPMGGLNSNNTVIDQRSENKICQLPIVRMHVGLKTRTSGMPIPISFLFRTIVHDKISLILKTRVYQPLVLRRHGMGLYPRISTRTTQNVGEISRPAGMSKGVRRSLPWHNRLVCGVPDLRNSKKSNVNSCNRGAMWGDGNDRAKTGVETKQRRAIPVLSWSR